MTRPASPEKLWLSPSELAAMDLPGLSPRRNRVVEMAAQYGWAERFDAAGQPVARKRAGRGGGWEYHYSVLPVSAVQELARRGVLGGHDTHLSEPEMPSKAPLTPANDVSAWAWFEAQTAAVKNVASARLTAVRAVETNVAAGMSVNSAVALAATEHGVSPATLWNWRKLVCGVPTADWLPALAPRRKGGGKASAVDPRILTYFKSYRLRTGPQGFEESRRKTIEYALTLGLSADDVPCTKKLTRELRRTTPKRVITLKTKGPKALQESIPAQIRDRSAIASMEAVNIDGHKWDVFVRWPDGRIGRPISVVIQDLGSNKILACRTSDVESAIQTRLAWGDMMQHGIPQHCTLDNGRAFASKWITGGMLNRYRFKVQAEEPQGIITAMGVKVHWATPGHGQAKPIERCFGDLEQSVAGDPRCTGAWTGKNPHAKPEDYASKAVDLDVFLGVVAKAVAEYNARPGRKGGNAQGRSYDATFEARKTKPITWATPEQRRLTLLTGENVRAHKRTGAITLFGNTYYDQALYDYAGELLTVRFDPDDLHSPIDVHALDGRLICRAPVQAAVGFYDAQGAADRKRLVGNLKKSTKQALVDQALLSAAELAAAVPLDVPDAPIPQPSIIRPMRTRGGAQAAPKAHQDDFRDRFAAAIGRLEADENRRNFTVLDGGLNPQSEPERPNK